jgi:hypothetical protein
MVFNFDGEILGSKAYQQASRKYMKAAVRDPQSATKTAKRKENKKANRIEKEEHRNQIMILLFGKSS